MVVLAEPGVEHVVTVVFGCRPHATDADGAVVDSVDRLGVGLLRGAAPEQPHRLAEQGGLVLLQSEDVVETVAADEAGIRLRGDASVGGDDPQQPDDAVRTYEGPGLSSATCLGPPSRHDLGTTHRTVRDAVLAVRCRRSAMRSLANHC